MTSSKDKKTKLKIEKAEYNADLILSRVFLLLGTNQLEFSEVFKYELAAVPPSLFHETGNTRYPKTFLFRQRLDGKLHNPMDKKALIRTFFSSSKKKTRS